MTTILFLRLAIDAIGIIFLVSIVGGWILTRFDSISEPDEHESQAVG